MDVIKTKKPPFYKKKVFVIGVSAVILVMFIGSLLQLRMSAHTVDVATVVTATVQRGDFSIKVSGPGILAPKDVRVVASTVSGRVERILLRPGAEVEKGQLIVELENPTLAQEAEEMSWEVEAMEKETIAFKVQNDTRLLEMKVQVMRHKMEHKVEKIRLDAETNLIEQNNSTVSIIDYKARQLNVEQMLTIIQMDIELMAQLKQNLDAQYAAQVARFNRLKKGLERTRFQLTSLHVKAPVSGILQALPLELGQQLAVGSNIARFARKDDLISELQIPELSASALVLGQKVVIDTRFSTIEGKVVRIDPTVINGAVQVDVELISELPEEARPDLSINGEIFISEKKNALYVRRPAFSQSNRSMSVFRLAAGSDTATKGKVQFGLASSLEIEVVSGLKAGDRIVVSESTDFAAFDKITIE